MGKEEMMAKVKDINSVCMNVLFNEPMKNHTTFKVGGSCIALALPDSCEELRNTIMFCKSNGVPYFILGKGSNVLVSDDGFDGVVIKEAGDFCKVVYDEENDLIIAGGGTTLSQLSALAAEKGLCGFEFASGIPGTVGGGVRMNAGAYGGEISQVLVDCSCVDESGDIKVVTNEDAKLTYRHSIFCDNSDLIIVSASFRCTAKGEPTEIKKAVLELNKRRKEKQPLEYPSAGSTFKRPEGYFAAKLIEDAGLKGYRYGNAAVSDKHSGFVVNLGDASCEDIIYVIKYVREVVREKFGVVLEPEVVFLGTCI